MIATKANVNEKAQTDIRPSALRATRVPVPLPIDWRPAAGNFAVQRAFRGAVQAKLRVGSPGDLYEQEADRVAEQVMSSEVPSVQRKCEQCRGGGACSKCEEGETLQTKESPGHQPQITPGLESRLSSLEGSGQPLPASVRAFFEPRFGQDFGGVRLHTDGQAAESASALGARAFTVGQSIVFGAGEYAPETFEGRKLLAHEFTHVVQQSRAPSVKQPIRRQVTSGVLTASPAEAEGVPRLKWSEESERMYRKIGDDRAADAIRNCRLHGGGACSLILTEEEANAIITREATGGQGAGASDLSTVPLVMGMMIGPGLPLPGPPPVPPGPVPPLPPIPGSGGLGGLATHLAAQAEAASAVTPAAAPATAPAAASGGLGIAGSLAGFGLIVAASAYAAWRYTAPQRILLQRGYIILRPPLSVCITGCHYTAPQPNSFPRLFPSVDSTLPPFFRSSRFSQDELDAIRGFLEGRTQPVVPQIGPPAPPLIMPPGTTFPFPLDLSRRQRGGTTGPMFIPNVDPLTGEEIPTSDPCDYSPMKNCIVLGYPFGSFAAAEADLRSRHSNMQTSGTQGSASGDCFKDGRPRNPATALASGATHTTYRIPNVAGPQGVIASIVCCNCCTSIPGSSIPIHSQHCAIVKEKEARANPAP